MVYSILNKFTNTTMVSDMETGNTGYRHAHSVTTSSYIYIYIYTLYKSFDKIWLTTCEWYIPNRTRGILPIVATAVHPLLRSFSPRCAIFDEASQIVEAATVAVLGRYGHSIKKAILVGDIKQNAPFVHQNGTNEYDENTQVSLMERLETTGFPILRLIEQYRMQPDIARTVSYHFYNNRLANASNTLDRVDYGIWQAFVRRHTRCKVRHSIFMHCDSSVLYQIKHQRSSVNPRHLFMVQRVVQALLNSGAKAEQIAVLSAYRGQLRLLRTIIRPDVTVATVDSSQGNEFDFVVLDLVTPGGWQYPLGFMGDARRACVALSRAKLGMAIVGNGDMGNFDKAGLGSRRWDAIVKEHRARDAVFKWPVADEEVDEMCARLGIPGELFERVQPRERVRH